MINNKSYSKTRQGARSFSRDASYVNFNQDNTPDAIIRGTNRVGEVSVEQARLGFREPTVQSAIDDVVNSMIIPVNGILETTVDLNPAGTSQVDRITISGISNFEHIMFNGFKVATEIGDDSVDVTTKLIDFVNDLIQQDLIFESVTQIDDSIFEVEYRDTRPHEPLEDVFTNGITIDSEVVVESRSGFGTWVKIGEREIVTDTTGYVWRRTS